MKIASSKREILVTRSLLYSKGFRSSRPKFILLKISGDITSGDNTGYHSKHRDQTIVQPRSQGLSSSAQRGWPSSSGRLQEVVV